MFVSFHVSKDISEDGWAYRTKIFDTLLVKLMSGTSLKVHLFPFSYIKPNIKRIVRVNNIYFYLLSIFRYSFILPIEEGLFAITMKPFDVVKLKIMTIAMSRIDLFMRNKHYHQKENF